MKPDKPISAGQGSDSPKESTEIVFPAFLWIRGVVSCVFWSTVRYVKNIPSRVKNKFLRWRNLRKRMPHRKTKNKIYVLIGYTTRENIDRRYRAVKVQHMIRSILLGLIVVVFLMIMFKWIDPLRKSDQYKQMVGISNMKELTKADPFGIAGETSRIMIYTPSITPSLTPSVTPTPEVVSSET